MDTKMYDVYCISAGQLDIKKDATIINKRNMYLNYGLLTITSIIHKNNLNPIQLHGHFTKPEYFLENCINLGISNTKYPVFISMPSFYALTWVKEFTKLLKDVVGIERIVLGGRWVIDGESELLSYHLPHVDHIVDGLGENKIKNLLNRNENCDNILGYTPLNYNLLYNRHLYQPSIEVSRGCGKKCSFCQERNEKLQPLKHPEDLMSEINNTIIHDDLLKMTPYFEASMFKPNDKWLESLIEQRETNKQYFKWRAESRVDSLPPKLIPLLAKSGLKVLDLGLESASHQQIVNMGKSTKPEKYLHKASELLNTAAEFGINVKINIMLYAGETIETIDETYHWLERHRQFIKGLSVGPVIAFGWEHKKRDFIKSLINLGATTNEKDSITGITNINLSTQIDRNKALELSKEISRDFMTDKDYFYLKSFSYFPRNYTFDDFSSDIKKEKKQYNFTTEETK